MGEEGRDFGLGCEGGKEDGTKKIEHEKANENMRNSTHKKTTPPLEKNELVEFGEFKKIVPMMIAWMMKILQQR